MPIPPDIRRQWLWALLLAGGSLVVTGILAWLAGRAATDAYRTGEVAWWAEAREVTRYAPPEGGNASIDPLIIRTLDESPGSRGLMPVAYEPGILPLGVYMPRYGSDPLALDASQQCACRPIEFREFGASLVLVPR